LHRQRLTNPALSRFKLWGLKINTDKPVLDNPDDPNRPLQAQVKGPEKSRRKRRP